MTPELTNQTRAGERKGARRHHDETADNPALVADHSRDGLDCSVEHEGAQSGTIRANTSLRLATMNRHVYWIVAKGLRQNIQELTTSARIGIGDGFVYHRPAMVPATHRPRAVGRFGIFDLPDRVS